MADKKHILTYTGLKQYEDELQDLKVNKRQEIAQKIKEARELALDFFYPTFNGFFGLEATLSIIK